MTLDQLIEELRKHDPTIKVPIGFSHPHSYRGDYAELAFLRCMNTNVVNMLQAAVGALGATYQGYKGGLYTMSAYTRVHLVADESAYGQDTIGPVMLAYMLGKQYDTYMQDRLSSRE